MSVLLRFIEMVSVIVCIEATLPNRHDKPNQSKDKLTSQMTLRVPRKTPRKGPEVHVHRKIDRLADRRQALLMRPC